VTVLGRSSGSTLVAVDTTTAKKATADKEVTDAAMAKVMDDAVAAMVKAAADKVAADAVVTKKVADDATLMKGVPEETTGDQQISPPDQFQWWGPRGLLR
jgi:serine acetyltransferase